MKLQLLEEPVLQFATGTHIDIRAGMASFGAFDRGGPNVPNPIGVGLVGTTHTVDGARDWLESCRHGVNSPEEKLRELRPDFPGMTDAVFGTRINTSDAATRTITRHELTRALEAPRPMQSVVELFLDHARDLSARSGLHVLVIAPPAEVFLLGDQPPLSPDAGIDDAQEQGRPYMASFHDAFKAKALDLAVPCQLLRPDTYGGGSTTRLRRASLQDKATRAWNFHTAIYYKAGGTPWRLVRQPSALSTCYIGASFFRSLTGERVLTSVAQVFDERGEGLIVQGGNARLDKDDRTPHLTEEDARVLLATGLATYRREHKTMPARVLVHKTSYFDEAEVQGCRAAATEEHVEYLDLVSVRRAGVRLVRNGQAPVLRGTTLAFDSESGVVYLKGTVPYFRTYPGPYIPRGLEFTLEDGESGPFDIAKELLALSKLNFNNTQFDSGDPITVRAARRVGDILKHVESNRPIQSRFRYFT